MNITFFIGNGFDINLGLKTDYPSFFEEYSKLKNADMISSALERKEYWSNLELALGEITEKINTEADITAYFDSKSVVEGELIRYLKKEEDRLRIIDPAKLSKEIQNHLQALPSEFDVINHDYYQGNILGGSIRPIVYRFISFNYTNCLDRILQTVIDDKSHLLLSHRCSSSIVSDTLMAPFHIHGSCEEGLIMGVGSSEQIKNASFLKNPLLQRGLIKKETNERLGNRKVVDAQNIINDSGVVVLYGLSFGDTDSYWWRYLMNWLKTSNYRRLVIFKHDNRGFSPLATESLRRKEAVISDFLKKAGETDLVTNPYSSQIVVVNNGKIFNFENVKAEGKGAPSEASK